MREDNIKIDFRKIVCESMEQIQQCPVLGCCEYGRIILKLILEKNVCESTEQIQQCPVMGCCVDGRIILKLILEKLGVKVWNRFSGVQWWAVPVPYKYGDLTPRLGESSI
jgi:hypothetical protein